MYWRFAFERQRIFERRLTKDAPPWTSDPILRNYKFCNVYRAADRESQYLIRNVAYSDEVCSAEDRLFQIVAFRLFSKGKTWESLREVLNRYPVIADLKSGRFEKALCEVKKRNKTLYTGAFILCASDAYGRQSKHLNHVSLLTQMFVDDDLSDEILRAGSLVDIYWIIHRYPLMGDFMSYQIAIDLNYSAYINFSENDFTQAGPGAQRGLKKAFYSFGDYEAADVIKWMVERQEEEFRRLRLKFSGLGGRALHAIDCQGLFCELDKYCREAVPELTSTRKRIKAKFNPTPVPIDYFFPPKWGINHAFGDIHYSAAPPQMRLL